MTTNFIFSPSNLKTYVQCPLKFKAMYVDRSVKYEQNAAAKRGEQLHALMETAANSSWDAVDKAWTDTVSRPHAYKFIQNITNLKKAGWQIHTETPFAMDKDGNPVDYYDKTNNFLRCRIDLWAVHPNKATTLILDWKSGKSYDLDRLQLQANALCMRASFHSNKYAVAFCYLDSGVVKSEEIDVGGVKLVDNDPLELAGSTCCELLLAVDDAVNSFATGTFLPNKNRFCPWCPLYKNGSCPQGHK